jgi:serine/threonine-protein kinase
MTQSKAATADDLVGERIDGRYTLRGVLGQGGMGVVYDGVHDELGRSVAIKVLNTAWATDRVAVERFLREARMASSFSHGNIVDVSDLGRLPDGRPYLVMPKIPGIDLANLLNEVGPQPAKRVAELLRGVASALDLIHAKGYVHRDIKPENLMYVAREDGSETVMLLDFGIAALVMSNERRLTAQGQVFGTPHYMAPETSTGAVPDARCDVYALAAVAFELVTGELPFSTDNVMQLLSMKLVNDAPSMSSVAGQAFPAALEAVIACGLARDPADRYASASALITALAAATDDAPVSWRSGVMRSHMQSDAHPLGSWRDARLGRADTESPVRAPDRSARVRGSAEAPRRSSSTRHAFDPNATSILGAGLREAERSSGMTRPPVKTRWLGWSGLLLLAACAALLIWRWDTAQSNTAEGAHASAATAQLPAANSKPLQTAVQAATDKPRVSPVFTPVFKPQPSAAEGASAPAPSAPVADRPAQAAAAPAAERPANAPPALPPTAAAPPLPSAAPNQPARAALGASLALAKSERTQSAPKPSASLSDVPEPTALPEPPAQPPQSPVVLLKEEAEPAPAEETEQSGPDPAQVQQLTQTATAALLRGEVLHAVELLREVTRLDPSHALAWRSLGLALERAGDARAALDAYQHYLSLVPTGQQADMVRERMRALSEE